MFGKAKTTPSEPIGDLQRALDAAITAARTARVDPYTIETALEQRRDANRYYKPAAGITENASVISPSKAEAAKFT